MVTWSDAPSVEERISAKARARPPSTHSTRGTRVSNNDATHLPLAPPPLPSPPRAPPPQIADVASASYIAPRRLAPALTRAAKHPPASFARRLLLGARSRKPLDVLALWYAALALVACAALFTGGAFLPSGRGDASSNARQSAERGGDAAAVGGADGARASTSIASPSPSPSASPSPSPPAVRAPRARGGGFFSRTKSKSKSKSRAAARDDDDDDDDDDDGAVYRSWGEAARRAKRGVGEVVDDARDEDAPASFALLVIAYDRPKYLARALESLRDDVLLLEDVAVYVSQDGFDRNVAAVATDFAAAFRAPATRGYAHWQRDRHARDAKPQPAHAHLAQHYKWAIDRVFEEGRGHTHVIVVEDDMVFSADFVHLFTSAAGLLAEDPTLWCVSSWNDNGARGHGEDPRALFRTSFFPGLGWMMRRELWEELSPKWPRRHWDHWMRLDATRASRDCVAPVVNRNFNIGEVGANMKRAEYAKYIERMSFYAGKELVDFGDLGYLKRERYAKFARAAFESAIEWDWKRTRLDAFAASHDRAGTAARPILAVYKEEEYERLAEEVDAWPFPRAHHERAGFLDVKNLSVILADARHCPYLPLSLRVWPSDTLTPVVAMRAQSCDVACRAAGRKCSGDDFPYVNTCEALAKRFDCENGCAMEHGEDVPNYVVDERLETFGQCLVTEKGSTCAGAHEGTRRLCPCA